MPTTKQRREAARRHLERQLQRREERERARKRFTLIASILGTILLMVIVTVAIVVISGGDDKKKTPAAGAGTGGSPTTSTSPSAPSAPPSTKARAAKGASVTFDGVTVAGAADLGGAPGVKSKSSVAPKKLAYKDLVIGKGAAATPASSVTVQYVGALYRDGKMFDSSWTRGSAATFSLAQVVKGFTQGIGGTTGVPPMKVGGRRIMILPAALGYGPQANNGIPANSPLVFVVDLTKVA
ncbi:MAG: FKBP-type peptidyl-prolyl cis-trans isomerase [Pseudonocardiales bacterium]